MTSICQGRDIPVRDRGAAEVTYSCKGVKSADACIMSNFFISLFFLFLGAPQRLDARGDGGPPALRPARHLPHPEQGLQAPVLVPAQAQSLVD